MNHILQILALFISCIAGHDFYYLLQKKSMYEQTIKYRAEKINTNSSLIRYKSLDQEVVLQELEIQGTIPQWLEGTLVRNGPAKFETDSEVVSHLFDGYAMLHAFSCKDGKVFYTNKFLESNYYTHAIKTGKIAKGFMQDPCKLIFAKFFSYFFSQTVDYDNANVNVAKIADEFVALTETPLPITFDPTTLATTGHLLFEDDIQGHVTSAHPHTDFETKETFNYMTYFGKESKYIIYSVHESSKKRRTITSISVEKPSYMHSFSITKNYIILTEIPFKVNPLTLLFTTKPFIKNFEWKPEDGTVFTVVDRNNGDIVGRFITEAFFTYHHVNAFEQDDSIVIDLIAYNEASKVDNHLLKHIFDETNSKIDIGLLKRFTINTTDKIVSCATIIPDYYLEMPQINYEHYTMKPYQYLYALGFLNPIDHSCLVKININNGSIIQWEEKDCSCGEPVFIAAPNAQDEDDGVLLSIVLDIPTQRSFLLVLDAKTCKEIGRAYVPHHIPYGLHGAFFKIIKR
ncbi:MAG TPA: carotenoid oxygenase family protein [Candidatus Babeliales bacterium]|nr:carotenoid oxygenase family protein [Candidatus Babeliales bacterium]